MRRLTEPGLYIFEGSNPASYGGKELAERESAIYDFQYVSWNVRYLYF